MQSTMCLFLEKLMFEQLQSRCLPQTGNKCTLKSYLNQDLGIITCLSKGIYAEGLKKSEKCKILFFFLLFCRSMQLGDVGGTLTWYKC